MRYIVMSKSPSTYRSTSTHTHVTKALVGISIVVIQSGTERMLGTVDEAAMLSLMHGVGSDLVLTLGVYHSAAG